MASPSVASLALLALLLASSAPALEAVKAVSVSRDHPVVDIIALLKKLEAKAEEDGKQEEVLYAKYEHWCQNSVSALDKAIAEEKSTMEKLASEIDSHEKNIDVLTKEISALGDKLLELGSGDTAADNERSATEALYNEESSSLTLTIEAVQKAIDALETAKTDTTSWTLAQTQVRAVMALVSYKTSQAQKQVLEDFAEQANATEPAPKARPELKAEGDYGGHVNKYGFKSQPVIELLKKLKLKFEDELTAATKDETNSINAYALAKQARAEVKQAAGDAKLAKEGELDGSMGDLSLAQSNFNNTRDDLQADSATLDSTKSACRQKAGEWQERSATRAKEREAIETAISILAKVTGVRTEAPSNPVPPTSPVSLLQLINPNLKRAVTLLRAEARNDTEHKRTFEEIASVVEKHGDGPFDQVVNTIQKMIFRLVHEQKQEDEHKDWCDQAISKTDASIADKNAKILELTAKIDDAVAQAASLQEDITDADDMVSQITAHMKEATEIRKIGKQENALAAQDAEDAQTALANAVAVLKDHYKETGEVAKESWEFLQAQRRAPITPDLPEEPSTWDSAYTAVADPTAQPGGIIAVLEQVSADFAQMASDTAAQEASDKEAFDEDMKNCDVERARRAKESEVKGQERMRQLDKQKQYESQRKSVSNELEATEQYLKDLQPACVTGDSTYEDRKAARAQEIEALKEAQGLLQNAFEGNGTNSTGEPSATGGFLQRRA